MLTESTSDGWRWGRGELGLQLHNYTHRPEPRRKRWETVSICRIWSGLACAGQSSWWRVTQHAATNIGDWDIKAAATVTTNPRTRLIMVVEKKKNSIWTFKQKKKESSPSLFIFSGFMPTNILSDATVILIFKINKSLQSFRFKSVSIQLKSIIYILKKIVISWNIETALDFDFSGLTPINSLKWISTFYYVLQ